VVTPVHNGEQFLAECIESVLAQTYEDFEYIIVDDGSTDASLDIMQAYARKDGRIRVERRGTSAGVIESHNIAFGFMSPMAKYCKVGRALSGMCGTDGRGCGGESVGRYRRIVSALREQREVAGIRVPEDRRAGPGDLPSRLHRPGDRVRVRDADVAAVSG
jgi:glycosyltransferase involved in cell wall biosynthesis